MLDRAWVDRRVGVVAVRPTAASGRVAVAVVVRARVGTVVGQAVPSVGFGLFPLRGRIRCVRDVAGVLERQNIIAAVGRASRPTTQDDKDGCKRREDPATHDAPTSSTTYHLLDDPAKPTGTRRQAHGGR
jgi:hypothetical protein